MNSAEHRLTAVPASVAAHTGLRTLTLKGHPLTSVAPGPFLAGALLACVCSQHALPLAGSSGSRQPVPPAQPVAPCRSMLDTAGLQALLLVNVSLARLPALGAAPSLTSLICGTTARGATLTDDGAAALLAAAPALRRLVLSGWRGTLPAVQALHAGVRSLELDGLHITPS